MNKRFGLVILLLYLSFDLCAQLTLYKASELKGSDFLATYYEKDPAAEAIVLYDIGKSYFVFRDGVWEVHFERKCRIQILAESGMRWGEVDIPYYRNGDKSDLFEKISGITYNLENNQLVTTALIKENCFDETIDNYWSIKKFAMPDLRKGSILEYEYHIISFHGYHLRDWEFQWELPVVYSELDLGIPPFFEYNFTMQGSQNFDVNKKFTEGVPKRYGSFEYNDMIHQLVMKNVPAFKTEDYICSANDYLIKIKFQLSKIFLPDLSSMGIIVTWTDLIKELQNDPSFGNNIDGSKGQATKILNMDAVESMNPLNRFNYITSYVKANFNWNGRISKYASKSPKDFIKEKYGNSADINLFLIGLLKAAKLDVFPVIISCRDHGKIRTDQPMLNLFNNVIVMIEINGEKILTDASEVNCRNDRLPIRCLNDKGLVVRRGDPGWIPLTNDTVSKENTRITYNFSDDLKSYYSKITVQATEYEGLKLRNSLGDDIEKISKYLMVKNYSFFDTSIVVRNFHEIIQPYTLSFKTYGKTDLINGKIYINPFLNEITATNPFREKERKYPVDLVYPYMKEYNASVTIPEGYKIEELPETYSIINDDYELIYTLTIEGNQANVMLSYRINKPIFNSTEYNSLKIFYNMIISKAAEKVILSKN
jgi:hypothetical protein